MQQADQHPHHLPHHLSPMQRKFASVAASLVIGLLFGTGLIIAGMGNPAKVLAFLDISGAWDPSLALVMAGAIGIATPAFWLAKRRQRSVFELPMLLPTSSQIEPRLIIGSLLFGTGWGLAGICPGPAMLLLGAGVEKAFWFVAAMGTGMLAFELISQWHAKQGNGKVGESK